MNSDIDVNANGGVLLGESVICDGFSHERPFRVQTHIHDDHMDEFETSKQFQDVLASRATRDMLIAEYNADLKYRTNFIGLDYGVPFEIENDFRITLKPNGHMLGSAQVLIEGGKGASIGYSGDFQWPMAEPIQVERLVVDSTYATPGRTREYTQDDANACLLELTIQQLKHGPIAVKGFRGTIQRALEVYAGELKVPILCSPRLYRNLTVFRAHGYAFDEVVPLDGPEAAEIVKGGRYVRLYSKGDGRPNDRITKVVLGAYLSNPRDPVSRWDSGNFSVCLSDHADFLGTLEYVRATGAKHVVTDNTRRSGYSPQLPLETLVDGAA